MNGLLPYSNAALPLHPSQAAVVDETLVRYERDGRALLGALPTIDEYIKKVVFHEGAVAEHGSPSIAQIRHYLALVKGRSA